VAVVALSAARGSSAALLSLARISVLPSLAAARDGQDPRNAA
jgi:hypothetical protein